ncbi:GrdX family protein [Geosporobacter ferrireducens]|uniref:GrdX protein n=1 Tax=Geosporobacter ferrireducens TaxID=1424294 RepID=A0A1D8GNB3_9FIRM|nr:GrdX family protein [Geosporobacter ferrireducens]AOT72410.1 GrdX protein [Geosporobacter ferrireducens]MTI56333.1 GrdX protein [Geosporobacter ferrireducens]
MKKILVTNNSLVHANYKDKLDIIYSNNYTYLDILGIARDKIHEGHRLLTHPLSGSVKPNETPYKSVAISNDKGELDFDSLSIIESSIETAKKFIEGKNTPRWTEKILQDFELIDYYLIRSAVESMDQFS